MLLEFDYQVSLFSVKMLDFEKKKFHRYPTFSDHSILGAAQKIKIQLPTFSPTPKVSENVCHVPVGQKIREDIVLEKQTVFGTRPSWRSADQKFFFMNIFINLHRVSLSVKYMLGIF
jgi:hypothetical protein